VRPGWTTIAACLLGLATGDGQQSAHIQTPAVPFRAGIDLVSLTVTVTDSEQHYVADLNRSDFVVLENGVPQDLSYFATTGVPLALALLIDTSASMQDTLGTAQEAAIGFARQLTESDIATVISFDSSVEILQEFTNDAGRLKDAIQRTAPRGSTSLYNALYIALRALNKTTIGADHTKDARRRAIIVLSDGDDTSSLIGFDDVLEVASRSDTIIYAIGLGVRDLRSLRSDKNGEFVLRRFAQQTGGRAFFPQHAKELSDVYNEIRQELSRQYSLAYESNAPKRDGQWRRIFVRVNRPGVTARTRQGYFAPAK
jgi:Ca-activated chloride channel family protein